MGYLRGLYLTISLSLSLLSSVVLPAKPATNFDSAAPHCRVERLNFSGMSWETSLEKPEGLVICVHGIGLCSQSYQSVARYLTDQGFDVCSIDLRGFSYPTSPKGQQMDLPGTVQDLKSLVEQVKQLFAGTPVVLLGESMGANVVLRFIELYPELVDGVICSAPAGRFRKQKILAIPSILLSPVLLRNPKRILTSAIIAETTGLKPLRCHMSTSPEHRMNFTFKETWQLIHFARVSQAEARRISQSRVMLTQGLTDRLANCFETAKLFRQLTCEKTFLVLTGEEHLIFEERVLSDSARLALSKLLDRILSSEPSTKSEGFVIGSKKQKRKLQRIFEKAGLQSYKYLPD